MKDGYIALQLVRDRHGRVTDIHAINHGQLVPAADNSGYAQIVDGKLMSFFDSNEILLVSVRTEVPPGPATGPLG